MFKYVLEGRTKMKVFNLFPAMFLVLAACADGGGGLSGTQSFADRSPTVVDLVGLTVSGSMSVLENGHLSIQLVGTDTQNNALTYSCAGCNHAGIVFNASTGLLTWSPAWGQDGTYPVTFSATDGAVSHSLSTSIVVVWVDQTPVFTNVSNHSIPVNTTYSFTPHATEANGLALNYTITSSLPGNASWDGTTLTWTPDPSQLGALQIDFEADDGQSDVGDKSMVLTVQ